jgi:iron transport multicopper oxidase
VNKGLLAFQAVPVGGVLQTISLASSGGLTKYTRPVFGNGRVYVSGANKIISYSAPVKLGLSCNPVNFGTLNVGKNTTASVNCTANAALTIKGCTTSLVTFQCLNSSLPATVASGASFSFPVTWNLTQAAITAAQTTNNYKVVPGSEIVALNLYSTATGYANLTSVQLSGTVGAPAGYLEINATQMDFGGLVLNTQNSRTLTFTLTNGGNGPATFTGFAWQDLYVTGTAHNLPLDRQFKYPSPSQ